MHTPSLTTSEIISAFPKARSFIKEMVREDERIVEENRQLRDKIRSTVKVMMPDIDCATTLIFTALRTDYVELAPYTGRMKNILWLSDRITMNKKLLESYAWAASPDTDFTAKIQRAKQYPIENLVKVNSQSSACCPLHTEKTPSFKVYRKHNRWWCYGSCATGGDSIDLYQKMHGVTFKEAVEKLS